MVRDITGKWVVVFRWPIQKLLIMKQLVLMEICFSMCIQFTLSSLFTQQKNWLQCCNKNTVSISTGNAALSWCLETFISSRHPYQPSFLSAQYVHQVEADKCSAIYCYTAQLLTDRGHWNTLGHQAVQFSQCSTFSQDLILA